MTFPFLSFPFFIPWAVALIGIAISSWNDIRIREVPDWISYSMMVFGVGFAIILTIIFDDYTYCLSSVVGLGIGIGIGYLMYYTGQWGGGDAKLLMGIGALIGINPLQLSISNPPFFVDFFLDLLIAGAAYGLLFVIGLGILRRKTFYPAFKAKLPQQRIIRYTAMIIGTLGIILFLILPSETKYLAFIFCAALFFLLYIWIIAKVVEETCMTKEVLIEELTEGDWILKDVIVGGKRITGPKDLGISKEQIATLLSLKKKKKIAKVWIKVGVPFVPSFLAGFLIASFLPMWYMHLL